MVCLQAKLVQRGKELGYGPQSVVRHVDAVHDAQRHDLGVEARPQPGLGDLVAAGQFQAVDARHLAEQQLQPRVGDVGAADAKRAQVALARLKVVHKLRHVLVRRPEQADRVEAALLDAVVHVPERGGVVTLLPVAVRHDRHGIEPVLGAVERVTPLPAHLTQHAPLRGREVEKELGHELVVHHQLRNGLSGGLLLVPVDGLVEPADSAGDAGFGRPDEPGGQGHRGALRSPLDRLLNGRRRGAG